VNPEQVRERETRWAKPAALAALAGALLIFLPTFVSSVSGSGEAEALRSVDAHAANVTLTSLMPALAFLLFAVPLIYLFNAARARSERVQPAVIVILLVAPLLVAAGTVLYGQARQEGAESFVAGESKPSISAQDVKDECEGEKPLAACEKEKREDDAASNAISDASLTPIATVVSLIGTLLFAIGLFYTCLWAMRTGLLSRFWGSLGMALGIAILIGFVIFAIIWFAYLGLLYLGLLPGGKPAAWEAGEAVPWETPGERAAAELEPSPEAKDGVVVDAGLGTEDGAERRKRKQRE
jgi:small-conductance mechanosensitive channel